MTLILKTKPGDYSAELPAEFSAAELADCLSAYSADPLFRSARFECWRTTYSGSSAKPSPGRPPTGPNRASRTCGACSPTSPSGAADEAAKMTAVQLLAGTVNAPLRVSPLIVR